MPVKKYKATSAGRRFMTTMDFSDLSQVEPERSLIEVRKKHSGRNFNGHITVRHKGGGTRKQYRIIDFKRTKDAIPGKVATIEYDPNRSARIALINYRDGEKRYILAPVGLRIGDKIESGPNADIKTGNCLPLKNIPVGTIVHNIELRPGQGGKLVRSAGGAAQLMAKEDVYAQVRMPSGEVRQIQVVPRDRRTARKSRARERGRGQSRAVASSRQAPERSRHRDESGRSPARRRRSAFDLRTSAHHAVGTDDDGQKNAAQ